MQIEPGFISRFATVLFAGALLQACSNPAHDKSGSALSDPAAVPEVTAQSASELLQIASFPPETMRGAVTAALRTSTRIRDASAKLALSGAGVGIARAGYEPTVQGSTGLNQTGQADYQVTVSQTIYDWGHTKADVERARSVREATELELAAEREAVSLEAALVYIEVKRYEAIVRAAQRNLKVLQHFVKLAQERADGGVGDNSEVELASIHYSEADAELEDAKGLLRNARSVFLSKTGYEAPKLTDVPELALALGDIADIRVAAARAPLAVAAFAQADAAEHAAKMKHTGLYPKLVAEGFASGEDVHDVSTGVGLRIVLPTFSGSGNARQAEAARLQAESARWSAETTIRQAVEDVQAFQDRAPTLRNRLVILKTQLNRSEALRTTYEDQFTIGDRKLSDLVSVQADVFRIERSLVEARYAISDLQYEAAAALGRLEELLEIAAVEGTEG